MLAGHQTDRVATIGAVDQLVASTRLSLSSIHSDQWSCLLTSLTSFLGFTSVVVGDWPPSALSRCGAPSDRK